MSRRLWIVVVLLAAAAAAFWLAGESQVRTDRALAGPPSQASEPRPSGPAMPGSREPGPPAAPETEPTGASVPAVTTASPTQVFAGPLTRSTDAAAAPTAPAAPEKPPAAPRPPPAGEDPAKTEADLLATNIRHFGQRFGGNPTGTNAEIVKALSGGNSGRATYLPAELRRLNDQGELVDRWGTPYFFHQMAADHMEVRSAGPDKQHWTSDDVVTR